jgi:hypothetical protein
VVLWLLRSKIRVDTWPLLSFDFSLTVAWFIYGITQDDRTAQVYPVASLTDDYTVYTGKQLVYATGRMSVVVLGASVE